jgi:hypothetical protein
MEEFFCTRFLYGCFVEGLISVKTFILKAPVHTISVKIVHFEGQKATLAFQFQGLLSVAMLSFDGTLNFFHLLAVWPGERKSDCQVFGLLLMAHSSHNSCLSPLA